MFLNIRIIQRYFGKTFDLNIHAFEMEGRRTLGKFKESHPGGDALTSLSKWHEFERDNPDTFVGMYQFWCLKPGRGASLSASKP